MSNVFTNEENHKQLRRHKELIQKQFFNNHLFHCARQCFVQPFVPEMIKCCVQNPIGESNLLFNAHQ